MGKRRRNGERKRTGADIETAAARMIKPDQLFWVVLGDHSKIEAEVPKLGIGNVSVIDLNRKVLR